MAKPDTTPDQPAGKKPGAAPATNAPATPPANDNPPTEKPNETPAGASAQENKAAPRRRRVRPKKVFETGVHVAGFGNVLHAWRKEGNRFANVSKSLGKKFADMAAGSMVSMSFRLIAITWVAGMIGGVTTFGTLGLLALATGTASAVYNYGKAFAGDKLKLPKAERHTVKFFDRARAKRAGIAFATGFLSGGLGLWLAKTEIVQSALSNLKHFFKPATDVLSDPFNLTTHKPAQALPTLAAATTAFDTPLSPRFAEALKPVQAAVPQPFIFKPLPLKLAA